MAVIPTTAVEVADVLRLPAQQVLLQARAFGIRATTVNSPLAASDVRRLLVHLRGRAPTLPNLDAGKEPTMPPVTSTSIAATPSIAPRPNARYDAPDLREARSRVRELEHELHALKNERLAEARQRQVLNHEIGKLTNELRSRAAATGKLARESEALQAQLRRITTEHQRALTQQAEALRSEFHGMTAEQARTPIGPRADVREAAKWERHHEELRDANANATNERNHRIAAEKQLQKARQTITEVIERLGNANKRIAVISKSKDEAPALRRQLAAIRRASESNARKLTKQIARLERQLEASKTPHNTATSPTRRTTSRRTTKPPSRRYTPASSFETMVDLPEVQRWIRKQKEPPQSVFEGDDIVLLGTLPIAHTTLRKRLRARECMLHPPGSAEAGILIVGRDHWTIDEIEEQIKARSGRTLRIYSQEIAVLAMTCGHDPIKTASPPLLKLLAADHPALRCCDDEGFFWPRIDTTTIAAKLSQTWDERVTESPLKKLGYAVGRTNGLPALERHELLTRAFKGGLPSVQSRDYMDTWGRPASRRRLRRMANFLAWLSRSARAKNTERFNMRHALDDWETDLNWLRRNCYEPWMSFRWPHLDVPDGVPASARVRRKSKQSKCL